MLSYIYSQQIESVVCDCHHLIRICSIGHQPGLMLVDDGSFLCFICDVSGDPDLKQFRARFKIWQNQNEHCDGTWWRFICNFGSGDLFRVVRAQEPFVNKFRMEFDPVAYDCIERWYMERTKSEKHSDFDISFYQKQPWVNNHS